MEGLPININDLISGRSVEWERLEFKEGWNPLDVLQTMCAFANDFHNMGGGYIVLGVEEKNGRPVLPPKGIDPDAIDSIQKELYNLGFAAMQPNYHPVIVPHPIGDRWIVVIWVPGGQSRPYKAKTGLGRDHRDHAYFIRQNSRTVKAMGAFENELLALAAKIPFDDRVNQQATVADLDRRLMRAFLAEVGSDLVRTAAEADTFQLARHMKLIGGQPEAPFPLNVGLLFFHPDPQADFFPTSCIEVVWFPDGAAGDTFTEKIFTGPLDRMLREALDYIRRNYINEIVVKHPHRAEATRAWNYPHAALEEALVNAVYHRSYEEREPIEVRITPEEIAILSYPGPDRSINMADLRVGKAVTRRYRNRRIGEFLKELELTEGRATGIPKIIRAMKDNGSPEPAFESDEDRISFLVRLPVHPDAAGRSLGQLQPDQGSLTTEGITQLAKKLNRLHTRFEMPLELVIELATNIDTGRFIDQPNRSVAGILLSLATQPRSAKELREALVLRHATNFRSNYLVPMLKHGLLEQTIPDKPTSPFQGYKTTPKGAEFLEALTHRESPL